jgi:myo-inositol-1(or 4)-monophosphatase
MNAPRVEALVEFYLPVLATAGHYARRIQPRIAGPGDKSGANEWTQALTDADLAVQSYVEVLTLAHQPDVGFFGEESGQSANAKYFPADRDITIYLDPINGTFLYQHQQDDWDIVLSIAERGSLIAAISYMPVRQRFYLAVRGRGAMTGDQSARSLADLEPLSTVAGSRVCMTYNAPSVTQRVEKALTCFDIVEDYAPERGIDNLNHMFTGKLDAYASEGCQPLDWGAMAFIVSEAGGCATHLDGSPPDIFEDFEPLRSTGLIVSSGPELHAELLSLLGKRAQSARK